MYIGAIMSSISSSLLSQTIDDHLAWMALWTRVAFFKPQEQNSAQEPLNESPAPPESFVAWRAEAIKNLQDQPAFEKVIGLYDQLHRLARLAILKKTEESTITLGDYESVSAKYQELLSTLRRIERAGATAESGLDSLTGLRSRIGMRDDLAKEMTRFQRSGKPFCLAFADIDYFKKVNDVYGHEAGDKVLSAVANYLTRHLRPFDDAWRWGGEEILLCLKEADMETGIMALERVRSGLEKMEVSLSDGRTVKVTVSFGLAVPSRDSTVDGLLLQADKALYKAKSLGRNRVENQQEASPN